MNEQIENLSTLITAFQVETANASITPKRLGSILQKMLNAITETEGSRINIIPEIINNKLYVRGGLALYKAGYSPCIFRYSVKSNHLTNYSTNIRHRGPKRKGWHIFFSTEFAKIQADESIVFSERNDSELTNEYSDSPYNLINLVYHTDDNDDLYELSLGYGKKTLRTRTQRLIKFGIAFVKPGDGHITGKRLITNIAPFKVHVALDKENLTDIVNFAL